MEKKLDPNYNKVKGQMNTLLQEMKELSKKNPDTTVNLFKLNYINEIIIEANKILIGKYKPSISFEKFDEEKLPSNSDIVMILAQYMNSFGDYYVENNPQGYSIDFE